MSAIGLPITLHAPAGLLVSGIIRDESPRSYFVELTSGPEDGRVIILPKANCINLPENPAPIDDEPDAGEAWKA